MHPFPNKVTLRSSDHRYFHTDGYELTSVSKIRSRYKKPFDAEKMSLLSARKMIREDKSGKVYTQVEEQQLAVKLREKWSGIGTTAADHGTQIHKALEDFGDTGVYTPGYEDMIRAVWYLFRNHARTYQEVVFYSEEHRVAGTVDKPLFRTAGNKSTLDIFDYKTNLENGIEYFSRYNNFWLPPLDYLEECSYVDYSIQMSLYAYMAELWGYKIGRLGIIYIDPVHKDKPQLIPTAYMRSEAKLMLEENKRLLSPPSMVLSDEF